MTEEEKQFNQWFDQYANGVKVFEEADMKQAYLQGRAELEQENAELKKQQFSLRNERNTFLVQNEQYEKDLIDFNENLTKAKEIIRSLYFIIQVRIDYKGNIPLEDEMYRANQFLNSEVEK